MDSDHLFNYNINGSDSWSRVFSNASAFAPLVERLLNKHGLPAERLVYQTPGTNAVFRAGSLLVKIFRPSEACADESPEVSWRAELSGINHAQECGVCIPAVRAAGIAHDRYDFPYIITDYIDGSVFHVYMYGVIDKAKYSFAKKLRSAVDKMDVVCDFPVSCDFTVAERKYAASGYPDSFMDSRREMIRRHRWSETVFVHGDLNPDNIILYKDDIFIVDFGDAVAAPREYEEAVIDAELFRFDSVLISGFYGGAYNVNDIADTVTSGLLIHPYGVNIIKDRFGVVFDSAEALRAAIYDAIAKGRLMI
jgi:serine/threonine protein kinase